MERHEKLMILLRLQLRAYLSFLLIWKKDISAYGILSFCLIHHPMRFVRIYHIHHWSPQASASPCYTATTRDMQQKPTIREVEGLKKPKDMREGVRKINLVFEFCFCLLRSPGNVQHVILAIYTFFECDLSLSIYSRVPAVHFMVLFFVVLVRYDINLPLHLLFILSMQKFSKMYYHMSSGKYNI